MSNALMKSSGGGSGSGIVPAVCSAFVPGVGQLVNGETDKAIGVFAVWGIAGLEFIGAIPLIGPLAALTRQRHLDPGVGGAYVTGKRKR
jgi:hypothetical protein